MPGCFRDVLCPAGQFARNIGECFSRICMRIEYYSGQINEYKRQFYRSSSVRRVELATLNAKICTGDAYPILTDMACFLGCVPVGPQISS